MQDRKCVHLWPPSMVPLWAGSAGPEVRSPWFPSGPEVSAMVPLARWFPSGRKCAHEGSPQGRKCVQGWWPSVVPFRAGSALLWLTSEPEVRPAVPPRAGSAWSDLGLRPGWGGWGRGAAPRLLGPGPAPPAGLWRRGGVPRPSEGALRGESRPGRRGRGPGLHGGRRLADPGLLCAKPGCVAGRAPRCCPLAPRAAPWAEGVRPGPPAGAPGAPWPPDPGLGC